MTRDRLTRSFRSDRLQNHSRVWRLATPIAISPHPHLYPRPMPLHIHYFKVTTYLIDLGTHAELVLWFHDLASALIHARRLAGDLAAQTERANRAWVQIHDEWVIE